MKKRKRLSASALRLWAAVLMVGIVAASLVTYAWFYNRRQLYMVTQIAAPSTLALKGPGQTTIEQLDLSDIKLNDGTQYTVDYVFCVTGTGVSSYLLELAHTTNIPFTYTIYKTEQKNESDGTGTWLTYTVGGTTYHYQKGNQVLGNYINQGSDHLADNTKHEAAYDQYPANYVQKNAEPLYFLCNEITSTTAAFADYYILELTWNAADADTAARYAKETDLVYLMAENSTTTG